MSDSAENASFDVEAGLAEELAETTNTNARLRIILLIIRSVERFKLGANYAAGISSSSSTESSYGLVGGPDEHIQDSGNVAIVAIPTDAAEERLNSYSVAENENDNNPQCVDQRKITADILREKDSDDIHKFGGASGVAQAPNPDLENGISSLDSEANIYEIKPGQSFQVLTTFFHCFLVACCNYTIFLLSVAAAISLAFGIKEDGLANGWINNSFLLLNIFALVIFSTVDNFLQERRSRMKVENSWTLKGRKNEVRVVRAECSVLVPEIALHVGDIAVLQKGDQVPADGTFIDGRELELGDGLIESTTIDENNPIIFYGSRVINGNARMTVTSTSQDTAFGKMMSQTEADSSGKKCKLEACLHKVTTCIHFSGLLISIFIIVALFIRYKFGKLDEKNESYMPESMEEQTRMKTIMDVIKGIITGLGGRARVLTTLLSVSLLGIVEGMPFVISVAIFIWNRKTLAHKASERDYLAPGNMASVTTIISGKFGGLTEHEMEVDNFLVGEEFVSQSSTVDPNVLEGLCDGIGTFFMCSNGCESKVAPLISWAEAKLGMKEGSMREQCEMISDPRIDPFQECCQVLLEKSDNEGRMKYLQCCGPPHHILRLSSQYYDTKGEIQELDVQKRRIFDQTIERMLAEESEVIAYARKNVHESDAASVEASCLIFMGMIGLKNTKRKDIRIAVSTLKQGGVTTILASGDDISVLKTIGQDRGLLSPGSDDQVFTGEQFRAWTNEEKTEKLEKIRIMGNCLPSDKILLIKSLKQKGEVVALVGQQTTDSPALKQADIGITSGTWSSEVAVGNGDINIRNGDFSFLVNLIENGRCFQENIQKFIQLELIVTISSSLINFTTTVFLGDAPITAVQLSWLNLVVSFVGGLALLTGPSTKPLMTMEQPVKSCAKLITKAMWRNIVIQAAYQTAIFVTLQNKGHAILGINGGRVKSVIYNSFFLCQIFNMFIAREPERRNIFSGLDRKNWWFWVALVLFLMCQAAFAVAEKIVGSSPGLNWKLWGACLLMAFVSWLLDWIGKTASNLAARWILDQGGK